MSTANKPLKAPFPAFGGKSRIAATVWPRLSTASSPARNYIEPFCFSAAMLLLRPDEPRIETINDLNAYVANFWRAIQANPKAVAAHADWPVNETDLHARHRWLVRSHEAAERLQRVRDEPEYFDAKIAGWWCWGACMWIGSGWCDEQHRNSLINQRAHITGDGRGNKIHRGPSQQLPHLQGDAGAVGQKVTSNQAYKAFDPDEEKRPQLCNGNTTYGQGVHKKQILTSDGGTGDKGINSVANLKDQSDLGNQRIYLTGDGRGNAAARGPSNWQQRPQLEDSGGRGVLGEAELGGQRGVLSNKIPELGGSAGRPQLADAYARGRGIHGNDSLTDCEKRRLWLIDWFVRLSTDCARSESAADTGFEPAIPTARSFAWAPRPYSWTRRIARCWRTGQ